MAAELLGLAGSAASAGPLSRPPLLLLGPPGSGRSALLFRAALAAASRACSARVLFLAPRALERLPGGKAAGGGGAIQKIHFLYPSSFQELLQLVASLHETFPNSPSMIALDGLEEYLSGCSSGCTAAQLVALLLDTSNHFSQKRSHVSVGCQLIVSMRFLGEAGDEPEHFSAIERYFPAKMWLHPDPGKDVGLDNPRLTKLIRAQLFQLGAKDQEWMVRFDAQGSMTISLLPGNGETENETVFESRGSVPEADAPLPTPQTEGSLDNPALQQTPLP